MTTTTKVTQRWQTISFVGYSGSVGRDENRAAHGSVCLLQAKKTRDGRLVGRKVNSNGRHREVGEPFALSDEQLAHWESMRQN